MFRIRELVSNQLDEWEGNAGKSCWDHPNLGRCVSMNETLWKEPAPPQHSTALLPCKEVAELGKTGGRSF